MEDSDILHKIVAYNKAELELSVPAANKLAMTQEKTVLFFPLNSPGHINSSLGIADVLKGDYGYRTVFLVLGSVVGSSIQDHGHELVILDEVNVHMDYNVSDGEDPAKLDEEGKKRSGSEKVKFPGFMKWPQIIQRCQDVLKMDPLDAFIESMELMDKWMVTELIENYDTYEKAISRINPDLVIVDAYYMPPCVVNLKHIPWVRLYSANPLQLVKSKLPSGLKPPAMIGCPISTKDERTRMRSENQSAWDRLVDGWKEALTKIKEASENAVGQQHEFYKKHGCKPLEPGQMCHDSPHLNLYMFPKAIDYDQEDDIFEYPERWFRCDSLVRRPVSETNLLEVQLWSERLDEAMKGKKEVVFFSLGSIASGNVALMKRYIEMFKNDSHRLYVISKGVNGHKFKLNEDNMIGDNYLPQTFFLERADLAIIHGGNNSVTECLYHGIPMIILPVFADQLDNARRIAELGLGKWLNVFNCTRDELNGAIDDVLFDTKLIEKIRDIGRGMRARKDSRKIGLLLKKLIENGHLDSEFIEQCRNKDYEELVQ